jgi:hypothetical protein
MADDLIRHEGALHLSHNSNFNEQPGMNPKIDSILNRKKPQSASPLQID